MSRQRRETFEEWEAKRHRPEDDEPSRVPGYTKWQMESAGRKIAYVSGPLSEDPRFPAVIVTGPIKQMLADLNDEIERMMRP